MLLKTLRGKNRASTVEPGFFRERARIHQCRNKHKFRFLARLRERGDREAVGKGFIENRHVYNQVFSWCSSWQPFWATLYENQQHKEQCLDQSLFQLDGVFAVHAKMGLKRANHFLPICYQKSFADSTGLVWVKFAGQDGSEQLHPKSVGVKKNLYVRQRNGAEDDSFEDFFREEVEDDYARLSQMIKQERDRLSNLTGKDLGALGKFIASQVVRGLANKRCVEKQIGRSVSTDKFQVEMSKQWAAIVGSWAKKPPNFKFHTSLPYVEERFITGDDPVVLEVPRNNPIWTPNDEARLALGPIQKILDNPNASFTVSLSPYIRVTLRPHGGGETILPPQTIDPSGVRKFNTRIREQCKLFILGRDEACLE